MSDIDLRDPSIHEVLRSWRGYITRGTASRDGYNSGLQCPEGHAYIVDSVYVFNIDSSNRSFTQAVVSRQGGNNNSTSNYSYADGSNEDHFFHYNYDTGNNKIFNYNYLWYAKSVAGRGVLNAITKDFPLYLEAGEWLSHWSDADDGDFIVNISYRDFF